MPSIQSLGNVDEIHRGFLNRGNGQDGLVGDVRAGKLNSLRSKIENAKFEIDRLSRILVLLVEHLGTIEAQQQPTMAATSYFSV